MFSLDIILGGSIAHTFPASLVLNFQEFALHPALGEIFLLAIPAARLRAGAIVEWPLAHTQFPPFC
jgi:hypothetical protein